MTSRRTWLARALGGLSAAALLSFRNRRPLAAAPPKGGKGDTNVIEPLMLEWTLTPGEAGKSLRVSYTVTNRSTARVQVLDQMVTQKDGKFQLAPTRVIVQNSEPPGVVALVRGWVRPVQDVTVQYIPGARALEPGQSLTGSAEVPLPLTAWHPNGRELPLRGPLSQLVLEIGYVTGEPEWTHPPLGDGGQLQAPKFSYTAQHQKFVRSAAKPLP